MNVREELLNDIDSIVGEYNASRQETRRMLGGYAIGKWVPVEERLPEFDYGQYWCGYIVENGNIVFGWRSEPVFTAEECGITYWLDLSLPEVEQ